MGLESDFVFRSYNLLVGVWTMSRGRLTMGRAMLSLVHLPHILLVLQSRFGLSHQRTLTFQAQSLQAAFSCMKHRSNQIIILS